MKPTDVCFLDASYTSCLTALLLAKQGVRVTLLHPRSQLCPEMQNRIPFFWPSLNDPPTRAMVAHGIEVAMFLNDFCQRGVEQFEETFFKFLKAGQAIKVADVERIGFEDYEVTELSKAVEFDLLKNKKNGNVKHFIEHGFGIYIDFRSFLDVLEEQLNREKLITRQHHTATQVDKSTETCVVTLQNGQTLSCEMILCNDDATIRALFPNFREVLVPMSDVTLHARLPATSARKASTIAMRSSNGHASGCVAVSKMATDVWLSGPRFLLPQAGANTLLSEGILTAELKQRLLGFHKTHLLNEFSNMLNDERLANVADQSQEWTATLDYDCWPCDEMPILGELGLSGRALGSAGWLATSLSAGTAAAHVLADFVLTGKNQFVHPLLSPRRLFIG